MKDQDEFFSHFLPLLAVVARRVIAHIVQTVDLVVRRLIRKVTRISIHQLMQALGRGAAV